MANVACCVVTLIFGDMGSTKIYGMSRNMSCVQSLAIVRVKIGGFITNIPLFTAGIA